jgi:protein-tyrosine phosphatase
MKINELGLESVTNARDIGGLKTKDGRTIKTKRLLRSGKLTKLNEDDTKTLLETYHLRQVIDLRTPNEIKSSPDVIIPQVKYREIRFMNDGNPDPLSQAIANGGLAIAEKDQIGFFVYIAKYFSPNMYSLMLDSEIGKKALHEFLMVAKDNKEGSILWHCTGGKDRTGICASALLTILGVSQDDIIQDYLATNTMIKAKIDYVQREAKKRTNDQQVLTNIPKITGVDISLINTLYEYVNKEAGGYLEFLQSKVGITKQDILEIQNNYLD